MYERGQVMSDYSTCKICSCDFITEDMIEDITGAKYCLIDSGEICPVCGVYEHKCEEENERTVNDVVKELAEGGAVNL